MKAAALAILFTPLNCAVMPKADHDALPGLADVAETVVFLASPANRTTREGRGAGVWEDVGGGVATAGWTEDAA